MPLAWIGRVCIKVESQFKSHHLVLEMLVDSRRMQGGLDLFQKLLTLNTYLTQ